ncbi:helix-turn-helix domain-containing protein [Paenibacillus allorhizosphaerae]|nr:AraC family transcriptional regulator [Paenibacillus allorhizosphaerae]
MEPLKMVEFVYRKSSPVGSVFQSHPNYEIFYFHEGKGNYLIGDKIHVLAPGDLLIMHGMTLHCPNVRNDEHFKYVRSLINFEPDYVRKAVQHLFTVNVLEPFEELKNYKINLQAEDREQFEAALQTMQRFHSRSDEVSMNRFRVAFIDLLFMVFQFFKKPIEQKEELTSQKEIHVQELIRFIEEHYTEDLHLEQLEKSMHVNKYYLSRIFREVTGVTIINYLYQRRINQAKMIFLMEEKRRTVTEIGYGLGFKHVTHFSRVFRQYVGDTPEQFRKRIKKSISVHSGSESGQ